MAPRYWYVTLTRLALAKLELFQGFVMLRVQVAAGSNRPVAAVDDCLLSAKLVSHERLTFAVDQQLAKLHVRGPSDSVRAATIISLGWCPRNRL